MDVPDVGVINMDIAYGGNFFALVSAVHESIVNTLFYGELLTETRVGDFKAVVPRVASTAYITGINLWTIDPRDPVKYGFFI